MLSVLSLFSFDFLALECINSHSDDVYFNTVYLWCGLPLFIGLVVFVIGVLRFFWQKITHFVLKCFGYGKTREEIKVNFSSKELGMSFHDEKKKLIVTDAVGEVK
jgi:hypothetical protein